jgi:hypothetical protein
MIRCAIPVSYYFGIVVHNRVGAPVK